ncbi:hypothetical protein tinsulaeT_16870 [Thalassotalea insulae]|uniref:F5/8 type C domain-containing protein n=1 Tax=Thalassotalea insulae TaxID=2056778 RepID=A0ABQ6GUL5_9GAMM|nr:discoidin domain-containing protein [Thalassotalea insulae]GLX78347.1 hypothetical protein tinsulaeT_16870 [Thalassotalea insulae]
MRYTLLAATLLSAFTVNASENSVNEYIGKISDVLIDKSNQIKISVEQEEGNELECQLYENNPWPLYFSSDQGYSDKWFEVVNLARRTQETLRIGYTPSSTANCAIEYLALSQSNGASPDDDYVSDGLTRSGQYGNIALIYTNNLTESSYTASDHYNADTAASAFDGYTYSGQITEELGERIERGIWLVKKDKENNEQGYWLQVRFNQEVTISGFRILVNDKSVELGRSPKSITIEVSTDGNNFTEHESYRLSKAVDQRGNFTEIVTAKYLRVRVNSNYGDSFIEIDELEIYSDY